MENIFKKSNRNLLYLVISSGSAGFAVLISLLGIVGLSFSLPALSTLFFHAKPISPVAALFWIILGILLLISLTYPLSPLYRNIAGGWIGIIAVLGTLLFVLGIQGGTRIIEESMLWIFAFFPAGEVTAISPIASFLIVLYSAGILALVLESSLSRSFPVSPYLPGIIGCIGIIVSGTFVLGYLYGFPFLYGSVFIPISAPSALCAFLIGISLVTAKGRAGFPIVYLQGSSVRAIITRSFLPVICGIILCISLLFIPFLDLVSGMDVVFLSSVFMAILIISSLIIIRVSIRISNRIKEADSARTEAEQELEEKNRILTRNFHELEQKDKVLQDALDELQESENRYRSLFESMQEGVILHEVIYDTDGLPVNYRIVDLNPACNVHAGLDPKEARGRLASDLYGTSSAPFLARYAEVAQTGIPDSFETQFEPMQRSFQVSVFSPMKGWFVTVFTDITGRQQMHDALVAANDALAQAQRIAHVGHYIHDIRHDSCTCSDELYRIFGYEPGEFPLTLEDIRRCIHPDDLGENNRIFAEALTKNSFDLVEFRIIRPDGSVGYVAAMGRVYRDELKKPVRIMRVIQDVTWRREIEESILLMNRELAEEKERAQRYIDLAGSLFLVLNKEGIITLINQKGCEILGLSHDDIIGKNWFMTFLPERYREEVSAVFAKIINREIHSLEYFENPVLTASGEERILAWHNTILYDEKRRVTGILSSADDITDKSRIVQEREELIQELEEKNTELERFVYLVSHDLKSPLITIEGFLGYLEKDTASNNADGIADDIARIRNATRKMSDLLQDLLDLSRIGRIAHPHELIPFNDLAQEASELVLGVTSSRGVTVTIMPNLGQTYGDRIRLLEVLTNLLENASKFMGDQESPCITIGKKDTEYGNAYYVQDNGIGIDEPYCDKIFHLFEKLNPKSEGTGIGLAIVKRIIELHGGTIWAESEPGRGTTFYFTLPDHEQSLHDTPENT